MVIKLAVLSAIAIMSAAFAYWAFLPARFLPGNRVRQLRVRLHLRLHPGKGFAHGGQLVATLGTPGRAASLWPDSSFASAALSSARFTPARGVPGARPLPARSACSSGGASAGDGAAADV